MLQVTQRRWLALRVARRPTGYLASRLGWSSYSTLLLYYLLRLTFLDLHLRATRVIPDIR
jgi:hypothetical protein